MHLLRRHEELEVQSSNEDDFSPFQTTFEDFLTNRVFYPDDISQECDDFTHGLLALRPDQRVGLVHLVL